MSTGAVDGRLTRGIVEGLLWLSVLDAVLWSLVWVDAVGTPSASGADVPDHLPTLAAWCAGSLLLIAPACLVAWLGGERLHRYAAMALAAAVLATSLGWLALEPARFLRPVYLAVGVGLLVVALPTVWPERGRPGTLLPSAGRAVVAATMLALLVAGGQLAWRGWSAGLVDVGAGDGGGGMRALSLGLMLCTVALAGGARIARRARVEPGDGMPEMERIP